MYNKIKKILESETICASAPCRIDMGGTLDISTFNYPLRYLSPATFNIAVDLRTKVSLSPFDKGHVLVSSKGFQKAEFPIDKAPFDHPLGLMFAIAAYFNISGVHIHIESASPPKSALGGSSAAAVALVLAFNKCLVMTGAKSYSKKELALLAFNIESSVACVPCGLQDQLAASFGGINAWYWKGFETEAIYKKVVFDDISYKEDYKKNIIVAYCGIPHDSVNINGQWVKNFITGKNRSIWEKIVNNTEKFIKAFSVKDYKTASNQMNEDVFLRSKITPDVLDEMGKTLFNIAQKHNCGARFTGAGGGGCIWALGLQQDIFKLKKEWKDALSLQKDACILDCSVDDEGVS